MKSKVFYFFISIVFAFTSCKEPVKDFKIVWLANDKFLAVANDQLIISDKPDTITTEDNILKTKNGEFQFVKYDDKYFYILNDKMDVLKFEKDITTETLDPKKIKYYYLATSYDVNYLTKATYEYREFAINASPSQFEAMKQKAEQNKISVEEQIKGDVDYVTKRHGLINFQDTRIYYFVNEFLSKKTQNEYITKKAQENGVPVNQMIFGDAGWLLRKEQKY